MHLYHTQLSLFASQTFLFHSALFLLCPSIPFVTFLSTSYLSHQILLFSSPTGPPPFPPCVQTTSTHCSAEPINFLVTPVFLHISFLTHSIHVTQHIFLRHFISFTFNLFSATVTFMFHPHLVQWEQLLLHTTFSLHSFPLLYN